MKYKDGYKDSQKNPEDKEELSCESNDGKYHTLIGYVKFKDGEEPEHMWFVDVHIEDTHIVDEDFYKTYENYHDEFKKFSKNQIKTYTILKSSKVKNFEFLGYIEGNQITIGKCNVVVTDGFTGNIAL